MNYLADLEHDKVIFNQAIANSDLSTIGNVAHKMQSMISQFQENELVVLLKNIEVKTKNSNNN